MANQPYMYMRGLSIVSLLCTPQGYPSSLPPPQQDIAFEFSAISKEEDSDGLCIGTSLSVPEWGHSSYQHSSESRMGTAEFITDEIITATEVEETYLPSPADDLLSLFYSALWVAAYNRDDNQPNVPIHLQILRQDLAGVKRGRVHAERTVVGYQILKASKYGDFLPKCQTFLKPWEAKIRRLAVDWEEMLEKDTGVKPLEEHFSSFYERGFLDYVELMDAVSAEQALQDAITTAPPPKLPAVTAYDGIRVSEWLAMMERRI
ncbi:hypothetical protein CONPUDRAFT_154258 [Coniophora puteana RWD-64-598 SS2]|uniref:Fungal-type protein kinase domain-containing protein n=1 Tax=Coniophora puteana (strain RWD-64-598) TaxID=741705 RepID=A0A5M3MLV7_CONPW|nr:uncharacterized protein CONPUDRAFT_154258 [Coniophora puteana RWD-64-598 SS2]EIW80212.1 hypothetical protein CONPUDRAFT_154258 [Coniophora puteana RWD-64-598 SS2]